MTRRMRMEVFLGPACRAETRLAAQVESKLVAMVAAKTAEKIGTATATAGVAREAGKTLWPATG